MTTLDDYKKLDNEFSIYEGEEELNGLTNGGFIGTNPLRISDFNELELNAARKVIERYLVPISSINKRHSSYELKHLIERILINETNHQINYVSNGTLILAMCDAGFRIFRINNSPNCFFNVSERSVKRLNTKH